MKIINKIIEDAVRKELKKEETVIISKDRRDAVYISANSILGDAERIQLCLGTIRDKIKDGKDPWYDIAVIEDALGSTRRSLENIKQIIN